VVGGGVVVKSRGGGLTYKAISQRFAFKP